MRFIAGIHLLIYFSSSLLPIVILAFEDRGKDKRHVHGAKMYLQNFRRCEEG